MNGEIMICTNTGYIISTHIVKSDGTIHQQPGKNNKMNSSWKQHM